MRPLRQRYVVYRLPHRAKPRYAAAPPLYFEVFAGYLRAGTRHETLVNCPQAPARFFSFLQFN